MFTLAFVFTNTHGPRYWCSLGAELDAFQDQTVRTDPIEVVYRRDPIGVVGLITAWNYPLNVAFRKVAPALIAGNCVVLKPSEIAGVSVMFLAQAAHDAGIPAGVFNVVMGDRDVSVTVPGMTRALFMWTFTHQLSWPLRVCAWH